MAVDRERIQKQAEKLVATGKIEAGIAQYQILVSDNPRDLGTLNKVGDLYVRLNKRADAIKSYTRIAEIYTDDGFFLKAIAIYKKITKIDPSHLETLQRLADLYDRQGLKTEARAQYLIVADALVKAGQPQKAISAYEALAGLDPENSAHRLALAELKMKYGMADQAARTLLELAQDLERRGRAAESVKVYEMALKAGRGDPKLAEGLCSALRSAGQHAKAVALADEIMKGGPANAAVLAARGESLEALGRKAEAEESLRQALAADPKRADAVLSLARLLVRREAAEEAHAAISTGLDGIMSAGRGSEALKVLESILALSPSSRPVLEDLYRVQAMLGNKAGIVFVGEKLADICRKEGRHSEALAIARRLADLEPSRAAHRDRIIAIQKLIDGAAEAEPVSAETAEDEIPSSYAAEPPAAEGEIQNEADGPADYEVTAPQAEEMRYEEPAPEAVAGFEEPTLAPEDEEFVSEHLTEAEVFVKYGLADRAIEQLGSILSRFPWHIGARKRLRDVYLEEGNRARAAMEAAALGRAYFERGDSPAALAALEDARSIDASCPAIFEMETLLQGRPAAPAAPRIEAPAPVAPPELEGAEIFIEEVEPVEESLAVPVREAPPGPPEEDLQEFDFYLAQKMRMEAAACLSRLETKFGPHPAIEERRATLGKAFLEEAPAEPAVEIIPEQEFAAETAAEEAGPSARAEEGEVEAEVAEEAEVIAEPVSAEEEPVGAAAQAASAGGGFFDLAAELEASLFTAKDATEEETALAGLESSPEGHSLDEIVSAFKKGIEQQVDAEDFETHYNLGIAYKEMGLSEEAVGEFQFAAKEPRLLPDCCSMLGILFREKGMHSLAVKWYRKGMDALAKTGDEERLNGIRYDLAEVLEQMGEYRQALDLYTEVYGVDSRYRDVGARVKSLEARLGH